MNIKTKKFYKFLPKKVQTKRWAYFGVALVVQFSTLSYSLLIKDAPKVKAATKINDASNFGAMPESGKLIVRTSTGGLYVFMSSSATCQIWYSSNGSSWAQKNSGSAPACDTVQAAAIDSQNVIHLAYLNTSGRPTYTTFSTSTDLFSGTITVLCGTCSSTDVIRGMDIAIDSNDKPHVAYVNDFAVDLLEYYAYVYYLNKVSGSWTSEILVDSVASNYSNELTSPTITINEDNLPEVVYCFPGTLELQASVGNANNATTFTHSGKFSGIYYSGSLPTSLVVDGSGDTYIGYTDYSTGNLELLKHNDNDAWTTWTVITTTRLASSVSLSAHNDKISAKYVDSDNYISESTYTEGVGWGSATVLQNTTSYSGVRAKWSYWHNNSGTSVVDYLFSDGTDIYWDVVNLGFPPEAPNIEYPNPFETGVPISTDFEVFGEDNESDYLRFKIVIYEDDCNTIVRTIDQTASQVGWSSQDTQGGTAYTNGTTARYTYQSPYLLPNTEYCWEVSSIDPGGTNTFGETNIATFTTGSSTPPSAPTLYSPASGATGTSVSPLFQLKATDDENDHLQYKIIIYNSDCSSGVQTYDQSASQLGWFQQNRQNGTAYNGSAVLSISATGSFGGSSLSPSTQYCWKAAAKDTNGTNTFGSYSATQLFTTGASNAGTKNIMGGSTIRGGSIVR